VDPRAYPGYACSYVVSGVSELVAGQLVASYSRVPCINMCIELNGKEAVRAGQK
jgi:hypothetical protein